MAVDLPGLDFGDDAASGGSGKCVLVLFPPLRMTGGEPVPGPQAPRDERIVSLAAALLRSGDAFAQEFLAAKSAARLEGIRRADPIDAFSEPTF